MPYVCARTKVGIVLTSPPYNVTLKMQETGATCTFIVIIREDSKSEVAGSSPNLANSMFHGRSEFNSSDMFVK